MLLLLLKVFDTMSMSRMDHRLYACYCVYTQTGEDNGDQTDQCNGSRMTLSTVGDRREKLRWL